MIGNVNVPGALAADIANKVDKVSGKGLSTNDFTDAYKLQLDNVDTVVTSSSNNLVTSNAVYNALTQNQSNIFSYIAISYTTISEKYVSTVFAGRDENEFKTQIANYFTSSSADIYICGKENSYFDISSLFRDRFISKTRIYFMNKFILKPDASYAFGETSTGLNEQINLDLSNIDTSNVTDMSYMFSLKSHGSNKSNYPFTSLDLTPFNTSNVTDMNYMFSGGSRLSTLKLGPGWDMRNVTDKTDMFGGYSSNIKVYYCNTNDTYNQLIAAGLPSSSLVLRTDISY